MFWSRNFFAFIVVMLLASCMDLVSMNTQVLHKTANIDSSKYKLHGRVYTMRGFLGVFSRGMDSLAKRADEELGVPSVSVPHSRNHDLSRFIISQRQQNHLDAPIVLVGHSLGADDEITVARSLHTAGVPVELLITLDPVNPAKIPSNVKRVVNIYKPHAFDALPMMRGVPVAADDPQMTIVENINLNMPGANIDANTVNHFNIDAHPDVQNRVIKEIQNTLGPIPPAKVTFMQWLGKVFHVDFVIASLRRTWTHEPVIATVSQGRGSEQSSSSDNEQHRKNWIASLRSQ